MRDAGCTAAQEIAFTFSNAIAYIEEVLSQGLTIDELTDEQKAYHADFSAGT